MRDGYDEHIDWLLANPSKVRPQWSEAVGVFRRLGPNGCGCVTQVAADFDSAHTPAMTESVRADPVVAAYVADTDGGLREYAAKSDVTREVLERCALYQRACDLHLKRWPYRFHLDDEGDPGVGEVFYATHPYINHDGERPWAECLAEAEKGTTP